METTLFKPSDHIFALSFLGNINTSGDSDRIVEDAAIRLFRNFIEVPSKAALSYRVTTDKKEHPQEGRVTTYY